MDLGEVLLVGHETWACASIRHLQPQVSDEPISLINTVRYCERQKQIYTTRRRIECKRISIFSCILLIAVGCQRVNPLSALTQCNNTRSPRENRVRH